MKYRLRYKSKYETIRVSILGYISSLFIDFFTALVINFFLFFLEIFALHGLYERINNTAMPDEKFFFIVKITWIIQAIIILLVNIKKQFLYCEFRHNGLFLYSNNSVALGYRYMLGANSLIPYNEIVSVKKTVNHNVPETYSIHFYLDSKFFSLKRKIKKNIENKMVPAIAFGDFSGECIAVELKNHKTLYLPIYECDEFIEEYKNMKAIIDKASEGVKYEEI